MVQANDHHSAKTNDHSGVIDRHFLKGNGHHAIHRNPLQKEPGRNAMRADSEAVVLNANHCAGIHPLAPSLHDGNGRKKPYWKKKCH